MASGLSWLVQATVLIVLYNIFYLYHVQKLVPEDKDPRFPSTEFETNGNKSDDNNANSDAQEANTQYSYTHPPTVYGTFVFPSSQTRNGIIHRFPSIPIRLWPGEREMSSLETFKERRDQKIEDDRPLYFYNPNIFPLYKNNVNNNQDKKSVLTKELTDIIVGREVLSDDQARAPYYIGVWRISNFSNCFGPGRGIDFKAYRNYIGIALLDENLQILQGSDVVIDVNKALDKTGKRQLLEDCHFAPMSSNEESDEGMDLLYLICNGGGQTHIFNAHLALDKQISTQATSSSANHHIDISNFDSLPNKYGNGLHLYLLMKSRKTLRGKNFSVFHSYVNQTKHSFLDTWPSHPHEVKTISTKSGNQGWDINVDGKKYISDSDNTSKHLDPELKKRLIPRERGSTCCVEAYSTKLQKTVLLGFSHTKTNKNKVDTNHSSYHYISRVYAFAPEPPFSIIAESDYFCLGFGGLSELDHGASQTPESNITVVGYREEFKLFLVDHKYDCPTIHFITGLVDKIGDSSKVLISYGVNDCYPRMIEVQKQYLLSLLKL